MTKKKVGTKVTRSGITPGGRAYMAIRDKGLKLTEVSNTGSKYAPKHVKINGVKRRQTGDPGDFAYKGRRKISKSYTKPLSNKNGW